jgi:hypothetical protein
MTTISQAHQRLEIPVYGAAGDALRGGFYGGLRTALGADVSEEIATKLGAALEARFAGFGVAVQTLDFVREVADFSEISTVRRTIWFWNGTSEESALSRRQEMFFPELEDPTGAQWGPLLARIGAQGNAGIKKSRG